MTNVRKMALVDPRLLETLRNPMQPPVDTTLRDLDADMTSILDRTDIEVSDKVRLYNQALLRYNSMTKTRATKPTRVVVVPEEKVMNGEDGEAGNDSPGETEIRDDTGRPVPFERGKVTVTLHFRRRSTGLFR